MKAIYSSQNMVPKPIDFDLPFQARAMSMIMRMIFLVSATVLLLGCGGGNSTSTPTSTLPPSPPTTSDPSTPIVSVTFSNNAISKGLVFSSGYDAAFDEMPRYFAGGSASGDFDNDLDIDWFVASIAPNRLYENMDSVMINNLSAGISQGAWGWGACLADFDMDGDLDIYHTNGWQSGAGDPAEPYTEDTSRLFINNGDKTFENQADAANINDALQGRGVVCADFNGDRQIDILLTLNESDQAALLWLNQNENANTLAIRLQGTGANTQGLGAKIIVTEAGQSQLRTINLNSNFTSHNPAVAYFGFETASSIDEISVLWPDGQESVMTNVSVNQSLSISHPDAP